MRFTKIHILIREPPKLDNSIYQEELGLRNLNLDLSLLRDLSHDVFPGVGT